jgi:hypothetical protein
MNERIDNLFVQARFDAGSEKQFNATMRDVYHKFAELIVRECATAFEAEVDTWKEMDPYQGSMKRKGTQAIKQHFGVEQ